MNHYQKIAIGLLGLTNPEMFMPRPKPGATAAAEIEPSSDRASRERHSPRQGRGARALRALRFMMSALALGSRTVSLADNSELRRDLRDSARLVYGPDEA
jgi:hypothetical protein